MAVLRQHAGSRRAGGGGMNDGLTERQVEVLGVINRYRAEAQCNPTCAEISHEFGWASANAANEHLHALAKRGAIMFRYGKSRGYVVLRQFVDIGLKVAA